MSDFDRVVLGGGDLMERRDTAIFNVQCKIATELLREFWTGTGQNHTLSVDDVLGIVDDVSAANVGPKSMVANVAVMLLETAVCAHHYRDDVIPTLRMSTARCTAPKAIYAALRVATHTEPRAARHLAASLN